MSKKLVILAFGIVVVLAPPDRIPTGGKGASKKPFHLGSRKVESLRLVLRGLSLKLEFLLLRWWA